MLLKLVRFFYFNGQSLQIKFEFLDRSHPLFAFQLVFILKMNAKMLGGVLILCFCEDSSLVRINYIEIEQRKGNQ